MKTAYEVAKEGGKHSGLLPQLEHLGPNQLEKAIQSHRKTADEHLRKLSDPSAVVADWGGRSERYRQGLLSKWQAEAENALEQASIIEAYRNEKRN